MQPGSALGISAANQSSLQVVVFLEDKWKCPSFLCISPPRNFMNARWRRKGGREGRGGRGTSWKSSSISVSLLKINIPDPGTKDWTGRSARFRFVSFPLLLPQLRHRITERIVARREKKKSFDPSLPHLTYYYAIRLSSCFQLTHPAANP